MSSRVNGDGITSRVADALFTSCRRAALEIAIKNFFYIYAYDVSKIPIELFRWKSSLGTVRCNDQLRKLEIKEDEQYSMSSLRRSLHLSS